MSDPFKVVSGILASAVADAATFTVAPPSGSNIGDFIAGTNHKLVVNQKEYSAPDSFGLALTNATTITVTNRSGGSWPAGAAFYLQIECPGQALNDPFTGNKPNRSHPLTLVQVNLGAPAAIDVDGVCESQNRTGAGALLINGALSDGDLATSVATLDVPRNVIVDSGGADTAVITVTGKDEYGNSMSENITLNGTTAVSGVKAFKTITSVSSSATITNGFFMGTGDVLGLPFFVPVAGATGPNIIKEQISATAGAALAAATAGTLVGGLQNTTGGSTATSADVRGTYDPNAACDGAASFVLVLAVVDPGYLGAPQYVA